MTLGILLQTIRQPWLARVSNRLAQGEVRASFLEQLAQLFDALGLAVNEGRVDLLNAIVLRWIEARTETELDQPGSSLLPMLSQIMIVTIDVVHENVDPAEAPMLARALMPVFTQAMEYATVEETRLHVQHIKAELQKAQDVVERLEKSKSDFISVAAHELKTPLTLIEGYAAMFRDVLPEDASRKITATMYLNGIHAGTRRLREIVDDMIDVSLIDNNLLTLNFQPIWLNQLFASIQQDLAETLKQRRLTLTVRSFHGSGEMFLGDNERLHQAFKNVFSNAVKYTPDGGKIVVDGRILPGFVETTITDTGIGIDSEYHSRIFEKFGRLGDVSLHSSGKTKFKGGGPGLGLPITKGIIEAHGGSIWVESPGYDETRCPGSVFHILLPVRQAAVEKKSSTLIQNLTDQLSALAQRVRHDKK